MKKVCIYSFEDFIVKINSFQIKAYKKENRLITIPNSKIDSMQLYNNFNALVMVDRFNNYFTFEKVLETSNILDNANKSEIQCHENDKVVLDVDENDSNVTYYFNAVGANKSEVEVTSTDEQVTVIINSKYLSYKRVINELNSGVECNLKSGVLKVTITKFVKKSIKIEVSTR